MRPDLSFLAPERLEESLGNLGKRYAVTRGYFEFPAEEETNDLDWNYLDQAHRPFVHGTYKEAVRLVTGREFAISLNQLRVGPFRFPIVVSDVRVGPSTFYQSMALLGLFYLHVVIRHGAGKVTADWYLVSQFWLRGFHGVLHRRFLDMHQTQNLEDVPLRQQRRELRARGFRFRSDPPDYLSANDLSPSLVWPEVAGVTIDVSDLVDGRHRRVSAGPGEFFFQRKGETMAIWPALCPHEGGPLSFEDGRCLPCPWHGLEASALLLSAGRPEGKLGAVSWRRQSPDHFVLQVTESGTRVPVSG